MGCLKTSDSIRHTSQDFYPKYQIWAYMWSDAERTHSCFRIEGWLLNGWGLHLQDTVYVAVCSTCDYVHHTHMRIANMHKHMNLFLKCYYKFFFPVQVISNVNKMTELLEMEPGEGKLPLPLCCVMCLLWGSCHNFLCIGAKKQKPSVHNCDLFLPILCEIFKKLFHHVLPLRFEIRNEAFSTSRMYSVVPKLQWFFFF